MNKIETKSKLWNWTSKEPLPYPFENQEKRGSIPYNFIDGQTPNGQQPIIDLLRALIFYAAEEGGTKLPIDKAAHLAIGSKSLEKGKETIFVEYQKDDRSPTDLVVYSPNTGDIKAASIKNTSTKFETFRLHSADRTTPTQQDGTAIFLALIPTLSSIPEMINPAEFLMSLKELDTQEETAVQNVYDIFMGLALCIYDLAGRNNIVPLNWEDGINPPKIRPDDVKDGTLCPSPSKVLLGEFKYMIPSDSKQLIAFEKEKYYGKLFEGRTYTESEKRLIPEIPKDFVPTQEFVDVLDSMLETKDDFPAARITQVLFEGSAGTGKSATARAICGAFGLPMEVYTCGDRDSKEDMTVIIMPDVSDVKGSGLTEEESEILETFYAESEDGCLDETLKKLNLPSYLDCVVDADGVMEDLTGTPSENADTAETYRKLLSKATAKVKEISRKVPKNHDGVRYRMIKSTIIRAIEQGHALILEEVGNLRDPGALSFFNDCFDKEGTGLINSIYGDIVRHPDFVLFGTTNRAEDPGVHTINPAFRSRFQLFETLDNPSTETIMGRIEVKCGIKDESLLKKIAQVYEKAVEAGKDVGASAYATLRSVFPFAMAVKRGKDPKKAFQMFILNAITTDLEMQEDIKNIVYACPIFEEND